MEAHHKFIHKTKGTKVPCTVTSMAMATAAADCQWCKTWYPNLCYVENHTYKVTWQLPHIINCTNRRVDSISIQHLYEDVQA